MPVRFDQKSLPTIILGAALLFLTPACGNLWTRASLTDSSRPLLSEKISSFPEKASEQPSELLPNLVIPEHPSVDRFVVHYTSKRRPFMEQALERRTKYLSSIEEILDWHGLPRELSNVALVESGFKSSARSRRGAVGMWQFMRTTARVYGLEVSRRRDDRRNFRKSTDAAARYFRYLYRVLGSWELAIAAYNGGVTRVRRAVRRTGSNDFFVIAETNLLRVETRQVVPKVFAATKISREPESYGFSSLEYSKRVGSNGAGRS